MDPARFKQAYERLQSLDDRMTYKIRTRHSLNRMTVDQLDDKSRHLSEYIIELKDVVEDLFQAIAAKPSK